MKQYCSTVLLVVIISIAIESVIAKPAGSEDIVTRSTNYRCVKASQCSQPIVPNPSIDGDITLSPDLALYDGNGYPIWTLSFCKSLCGNEQLLDEIMEEYEDSGVRNEELAGTKVCCGDEDLSSDAKNEINWSLTKDPKRCQEFESDGYRCVPESQCPLGGYSGDTSNAITETLDCGISTRTFQSEERKKSNGNVCCRVATINFNSNNIIINEIRQDEEQPHCQDRTGYRCVHLSSCTVDNGGDTFANLISERRDDQDWADSASCDDNASADDQTDDTFVRNAEDVGVRSGGGGHDRKKRQTYEKVCCKENNIKPSCSEISDTHRCVPRIRCNPPRKRKEELEDETSVRSGGFDIHPSEYHCQADKPRSSIDEITDSYSYTDNIKERSEEEAYVRSDGDYDQPDYAAYNYDDDKEDDGFGNRNGNEYDYDHDENESELTCCEHTDILPTVKKEKDIASCDEKFGFQCVRQDTCRNSEILLGEDTEGKDTKLIKLGIRVDIYNQTVLYQEGNLCGSVLEVCCNMNNVPERLIQNIAPPADYTSKCGNRNMKGVDVTVDGKEDKKQLTQFGEWPNMCAISMINPRNGRQTYLGGASLISAGIVITAAHKVLDRAPGDITVRCGDWDARNINEPRPYQDRIVESISLHPAFDSINVYNDVALLHVNEPFQFDKHIDRICLPPPNDRFSYLPRGCKATGWGKDKYEGGSYQVLMAQVELPIVDNRKCQANLRKFTALSDSFQLDESFLCAGGESGVDTCVGDGGGPLMCPSATNPDQWIQAGITAWGIGCGEKNVPGVYASLTESVCFIDWATKCKHGDTYLNDYDYNKECNNNQGSWIDQEIFRLEDILDKTEFHLERSTLSAIQRKRYTKRRDRTRKFLAKAEDMQADCSSKRTEGINPQAFEEEEVFVRGDDGGDDYYADYYDSRD